MVPCGLQLSGVLKATSVNCSETVPEPALKIPPPSLEAWLKVTRSALSTRVPMLRIPPPRLPALMPLHDATLLEVLQPAYAQMAPPLAEVAFLSSAQRLIAPSPRLNMAQP